MCSNSSLFDVEQGYGQKEEEHGPEDSDDIIKAFMRKKDVAPWFRGTSIFHIQGANGLFNAIRDDTEQRTTHRVMNCLNLIGLDPMITTKEITFLMRLSRGNDLAFLWFLLEMHYTGSLTSNVGVNEQLICTAICHLDMITTLRELDRILPYGNKVPKQTEKKKLRISCSEGNGRRCVSRQSRYVSPYFEKLRRPTEYGQPLTISIPNFEVDFNLYASYKDPNYKVPNESNRWYADYDFNVGRRVVCEIIRGILTDIFENFEAAKKRADNCHVLCRYHVLMKRIEDSAKNEFQIRIRDKCLKSIFGSGEERKMRRMIAVKESLHKAVLDQLCEFNKQTSKSRKEFALKTITSDGDVVDVVMGSEYDNCCKEAGKFTCVDANKDNGAIGGGDSPETKNLNSLKVGEKIIPKGGTGDFVAVQSKLTKGANENIKEHPAAKLYNTNSQISTSTSKYTENYEFGRVGDTPKPSQTFFTANKENRPYQFDYKKIFQFKPEPDTNPKNIVKKTFYKALGEDIESPSVNKAAQSNLTKTASECAMKIWRCEVDKYEKEHENDDNSATNVHPNYNPEDKKLMDKLLSDAFQKMQTNPKFVLVQLPDAYKLPMLREWIAHRYGKVYSPKQRTQSFQYSLKVFHALDRMSFDFPTPTATQLGKNQFVNYTCRNYLVKKIKYVKDKFYQRLDNEIMEQSRSYWFAMRGYLCSNGPPRETFFAYMPSRVRDIQHFRLWKSNEHRPDKMAWDKRQQEKKNK